MSSAVLKIEGRKNRKGFTLIEVLIVVAIIGIIAAIAIPSLLRARMSANESATIADIRTVISGEHAYQSVAFGLFGRITCLSMPRGCISNYSATAATFLDSTLMATTQKSGYERMFNDGASRAHPNLIAGGIVGYCYDATPLVLNRTGIRRFGGDHSGRICARSTGLTLCAGSASLPATCTALP